MTKAQLVLDYLKEFGTITPAHQANKIYHGESFGSELAGVCRGMRAKGFLESKLTHGYEVFWRKAPIVLPPAFRPHPKVDTQGKLL